jgi:hypothetical protein
MRRWGDDEMHSYLLGIFSTECLAKENGQRERENRGGKYEPSIFLCKIDNGFGGGTMCHVEKLCLNANEDCKGYHFSQSCFDSEELAPIEPNKSTAEQNSELSGGLAGSTNTFREALEKIANGEYDDLAGNPSKWATTIAGHALGWVMVHGRWVKA